MMLLNEIRDAHTDGRLRVADLASRVGRSKPTIYRILNGEIDPPYSLVQAMGKAAAEIVAGAPAANHSETPKGSTGEAAQ